jgi:signal transduction histidine kinase
VLLTVAWAGTVARALPLLGGGPAWERAAVTGERALAVARDAAGRRAGLRPAERRALEAHAQELRASLELSRRYNYVAPRVGRALLAAGVLLGALLTLVASRVAGHLSRQLSRPLDQLVRWTELLGRGLPLPDEPEPRGAPEFRTLRRRMRSLARELAAGRARALEAERAEAFRETARRVAHELKNPLTPIRFAVERLRRDATPAQAEAVEVLAAETARLEAMARGFAQFGRLPDGPVADVDLGELARWAAATTVPPGLVARVEVGDDVPLVRGRYDALARALTNVLLNAVEASPPGGEVVVRVARAPDGAVAGAAVELAVRDRGCGIPPERLAHIWDPYVTHKAHGTGLGLAIARQTVLAHGGRVDAVSAVGRGTEVRFVLPVGGPAPAAVAGAGPGATDSAAGVLPAAATSPAATGPSRGGET